ncbi:MAG: replication-associated recombination protein A [Caldimicrobium sp.]
MGSLAERFRPRTLEEFQGQAHLFEKGSILDLILKRKKPISLIFWGPPGSGKTTLAHLLGNYFKAHFISLSAVDTSLKDLKEFLKEAEKLKKLGKITILFLDEIHRFNKAQQSFLLPYLEREEIILFGATTENPSFEIIPPLLSRVKVLQLFPLSEDDIMQLLKKALKDKDKGMGKYEINVHEEVIETISKSAFGDVRWALNTLEILVEGLAEEGIKEIHLSHLSKALLSKPLHYDKAGEEHYNLISAFHKSMRGSDPDATIYWLVRMLKSGEDPKYIARRIIICASEDVGLADPMALVLAVSAFKAYEILGSPEGEIALAEAALYVALAPKSNSSYRALSEAKEEVESSGALPVPLHLRNPVTKFLEKLGYGKDYKYPHDYPQGFVVQKYLPEGLRRRFYHPTEHGLEKILKERLIKLWEKS